MFVLAAFFCVLCATSGLAASLENKDEFRLDAPVADRFAQVPIDIPIMQVPQEALRPPRNATKSLESDSAPDADSSDTFDPWTIVWYVGSFGGLVVFFMVVSCSECCCASPRVLLATSAISSMTRPAPSASRTCTPSRLVTGIRLDTPPPSYHLFAPPPYDAATRREKTPHQYGIFVVPVETVEGCCCGAEAPHT